MNLSKCSSFQPSRLAGGGAAPQAPQPAPDTDRASGAASTSDTYAIPDEGPELFHDHFLGYSRAVNFLQITRNTTCAFAVGCTALCMSISAAGPLAGAAAIGFAAVALLTWGLGGILKEAAKPDLRQAKNCLAVLQHNHQREQTVRAVSAKIEALERTITALFGHGADNSKNSAAHNAGEPCASTSSEKPCAAKTNRVAPASTASSASQMPLQAPRQAGSPTSLAQANAFTAPPTVPKTPKGGCAPSTIGDAQSYSRAEYLERHARHYDECTASKSAPAPGPQQSFEQQPAAAAESTRFEAGAPPSHPETESPKSQTNDIMPQQAIQNDARAADEQRAA